MYKQKRYHILASLICGNPLELFKEIHDLEKGEVDGIHFDVMDGQFVPRLGLYPEYLKAVKSVTDLPVDVHLMIDNPEASIRAFLDMGMAPNDNITVHAEATKHLHYAVKMIKDSGIKVGVALNPATSLSELDYVLPDLERVVLMAINPGILGHKLIPHMFRKIKDLKEKLHDYPHIHIEIDGGVSPESAAKMVEFGADMLVCGSSSIYKKGRSLNDMVREFRAIIDTELNVFTRN